MDLNFETSRLSYLICPDFEVSLRSLFLNLVTQSPSDYLYTISIAFPARHVSNFHRHSSLFLTVTEAGSSAFPNSPRSL
jgi:hypothetical protein